MECYPDAEKGAFNLWQNRLVLGKKLGIVESAHTPPADGHYWDTYFWDSLFAAIINSRAGGKWLDASWRELRAVTDGQEEDGFIANQQFGPIKRWMDLERRLGFEKEAKGSNYTQPPILALAIAETYEATREQDSAKALASLRGIYPRAKKFYNYLERDRSNGLGNMLIGVVHPHETGRDSDPTFDFIKPARLQRSGINTSRARDLANVAIDYASINVHGRKLRSAKGDIEKAREIFWVNDVMMNCMYADNLYLMADLAKELGEQEDERHFSELAETVEQQILDKMWFPEARGGKGAFYALNKDGSPILETSISNLFPLVLRNLREEQLEALLDQMDESFDTPYPLPSVATDSPNYDPHNRELDRLWRGPDWINVIYYLQDRGLKMQIKRPDLSHRGNLIDRCVQWDHKTVKSSKTLVYTHGPREHYNPITGKPQRWRVKNFAWSNLAYVMLETT